MDINIGDEIECFKLFINNYYLYFKFIKMIDNKFREVWNNLKFLFQRIQIFIKSKYNYVEELLKIEKKSFGYEDLDMFKVVFKIMIN